MSDGENTKQVLFKYDDFATKDAENGLIDKYIAAYDVICPDDFKYLSVKDGDKYFYIDYAGNIVSDNYYDTTKFNEDGYAMVMEKEGTAYVINDRFEKVETLDDVSSVGFGEDVFPIMHLNISGEFSDISALINLPNLQFLNIYDSNVSDISVLANFPKLETLELDGNNISDISALANMKSLWVLSLENNNISDITVLENLTELRELYLTGNNISDISPLGKLEYLRDLDLSNNKKMI